MGRKAADDERPCPVRRAEALVGLAQQSLDRGSQMPNARIRPHLTVTMDYSTLDGLVRAAGSSVPAGQAAGFAAMTPARRAEAEEIWAKNWLPGDDHTISTTLSYEALEDIPAATLPDGSALAPAMLAKLACGSMINRVVFGPLSTILDAGREERIFPANQTRAIIARDRHCQFPGCDEGPDFGEIHHSLEWFKHNGTTHADLGILLCYGHHAYVHRENITIARTSGRWEFIDRRGRPIRAPKLGQQGNADPPPLSEREAVAGPGSGRNGWPPPTAGPPGRDPAPGLPPGNAPRGSGPPVTIDAPTAMCVEEPLFSDPPGGTRANRDPAPPF